MPNQATAPYKVHQLTARETEVLKLLADGYTNEETANILKVSARTIAAHRNRIMLKLNIRTLPGLVKYAILAGITTLYDHRGGRLQGSGVLA